MPIYQDVSKRPFCCLQIVPYRRAQRVPGAHGLRSDSRQLRCANNDRDPACDHSEAGPPGCQAVCSSSLPPILMLRDGQVERDVRREAVSSVHCAVGVQDRRIPDADKLEDGSWAIPAAVLRYSRRASTRTSQRKWLDTTSRRFSGLQASYHAGIRHPPELRRVFSRLLVGITSSTTMRICHAIPPWFVGRGNLQRATPESGTPNVTCRSSRRRLQTCDLLEQMPIPGASRPSVSHEFVDFVLVDAVPSQVAGEGMPKHVVPTEDGPLAVLGDGGERLARCLILQRLTVFLQNRNCPPDGFGPFDKDGLQFGCRGTSRYVNLSVLLPFSPDHDVP